MNLEIFDLEDLAEFLVEAKKNAWAADKGEVAPERSGFKEHVFASGDWHYRDSYTGFYCAPGQEIVRFKGQPIWSMAYDGGMLGEHIGELNFAKQTFGFLKRALSRVDKKAPFRGPARFDEESWVYNSHVQGSIRRFNGTEFVFNDDDERVFSQNYIGGLIVPK